MEFIKLRNQHFAEWTDEKISFFWDYLNDNVAFDGEWFSNKVGDAIIKFTKKYTKIIGNVLDYGSGKGFLSIHLTKIKSIKVAGCDFSLEAVNYNNKLFKDSRNYKGCLLVKQMPMDFKDKTFDIIFFIETIEHLTDNYLVPTLTEIARILKPGGKIIVTTPNDENLQKSNVICPDCGCVFHTVQHVRSFNETSLSMLFSNFRFRQLFCKGVDLNDYRKRSLIREIKLRIKRIISKKQYTPHLIYIGERI